MSISSSPDRDLLAQNWLDLWEKELAAQFADSSKIELLHGMMSDWLEQFVKKKTQQASADIYAKQNNNASGAPSAANASGLGFDELGIAGKFAALEKRIRKLERLLSAKSPVANKSVRSRRTKRRRISP